MNEILKLMNALTANELDSLIMRASIMLEKKRAEEAEQARLEKERQRQEKIAQEKRRQEEIAELQRKLNELQNQRIDIPEKEDEVKGNGFVMYDVRRPIDDAFAAKTEAKPAAAQPAPEKPKAPEMIRCPHCQLMNVSSSAYCANCGQKMVSAAKADPKPAQSAPAKVTCPHCRQMNDAGSVFCASCGQRISQSGQAAAKLNPQPRNVQSAADQVRYADETMKSWELLPGETIEKFKNSAHEVQFIQPDMGKKNKFYMQVTNKRVLFSWESVSSYNKQMVARMAVGGLVGGLLAESIGNDFSPYLSIPLTAISNCGVQNKKEFFIVADKTYVLKNHGYEKFLPAMIMAAKQGGIR